MRAPMAGRDIPATTVVPTWAALWVPIVVVLSAALLLGPLEGAGEDPPDALERLGAAAVREHDATIAEESQRMGADPDLIRTVIFIENTFGRYDAPLQSLDLGRTLGPMRIDPILWRGFGIDRETLNDDWQSIRVGIAIFRRLEAGFGGLDPRALVSVRQFLHGMIDTRAIRELVAWPGRLDGHAPFYALDRLGADAVARHGAMIEREARQQGIDPDLVRAITYVETAGGYYDIMLKALRLGRTAPPTNIDPHRWSDLGIDRETARDPERSVKVGVTLIERIWTRIGEPNPRKLAALWHHLGATDVSHPTVRDFAARVDRVHREKTWLDR